MQTHITSISKTNVATRGSYVGVDLDDFESKSIRTRTSVSSGTSDISQLKYHAPGRTPNGVSMPLSQLRHVFSKKFWQQVLPQSKVFFRDAYIDLKRVGWRHHTWRLLTVLFPTFAMSCLVMILPIITSQKFYQVSDACQPDSGFYVGFRDYNIWNFSGFFQITLGFGDFSFTMAKTMDVGWDIIVGRGGQAILAAVSFAVYTKALVRCMESSPVSFGTFEAVMLQGGSLTANFKLARDLLKNRTAQARAVIVWIIISASFVLAFPTILSAMSGYSANIMSFVAVDNGNMVLYSNFTLIRWIIHDAHRINEALGTDYTVTTGGNEFGEIVQLQDVEYSDHCIASWSPIPLDNGTLDWSNTLDYPICEFYWHVSEYAYWYGLLGLNQTNSTFNNSGQVIDLEAPSLNITVILWKQYWLMDGSTDGTDWSNWWEWPFGYYWKSENGDRPFQNFTDPIFTSGEFTYSLEELNLRGRCQQENTNYKWGFSFLILFWFVILFLVWCIGMYALWLDAFLHSRFDRAGRSMGLQRAILDLAYCMQKDMDEDGREMLSNGDLQSRIRRGLNGGRITYKMLDDKLLPPSRALEWQGKWRQTNKKQWLKRYVKTHRWTLGLFALSLGFLATALAGTHAPLFTSIFLVYGFGTVLLVDDSHKGRWLILLVCVVLAIVFGPIGPYVYLDKSHYSLLWLRQNALETLSWWYSD